MVRICWASLLKWLMWKDNLIMRMLNLYLVIYNSHCVSDQSIIRGLQSENGIFKIGFINGFRQYK